MNERAPTQPSTSEVLTQDEMNRYLQELGGATAKLAALDSKQAASILREGYVTPLTPNQQKKHEDLHANAYNLGFSASAMNRIEADLARYSAAGPTELMALADKYASRAQAARNSGDIYGTDGYEALNAAAQEARNLANHYGEVVDTVAKGKHEPQSPIDVAA